MVRRVLLALLVPITLVVAPVGVGVASAANPLPVTYTGSTVSTGVSQPTADKPQSKIWYAGGKWWALMATSTDGQVRIHRLDPDHVWRSTGVLVDSRVGSTADALWTDNQLFVASRLGDSSGVRVSSYTFDAQSGSWSLAEGPVILGTGSVRSVTIARDTVGRVWVTYLSNQRIYVKGTTATSISSWGNATELSASTGKVRSADIASIVSFGDKVGVMWSNQNKDAFYFAVHGDQDPVTEWAVETAWSGLEVADDHISLRSIPGDDRVFAAVKTSEDALGSGSAVLLAGLVRSSSGSWTVSPFATVAEGYTRPVLSMDVENQTAYVFFSSKGGGKIMYKTSPIASTLDFSASASTFISKSGVSINNATTTKQPVTSDTDMVVLAAGKRYYHGELELAGAADQEPPSVPEGLSANSITANAAELSWQSSTDPSGIAGYRVYRDGVQIGTPSGTTFVSAGLSPSTQYEYTVAAVDTVGNVSAPSSSLTLTTLEGTSSAIAFRDASSADNGLGGTSITIPVPATTAPGDVLIAGVAVRGQPTMSAPSGWTLVRMDPSGTTMRQAVFSRVAGAAEPASYTFGFSNSQVAVGAISAYSGVSNAAPVSASSGQLNAKALQITAPSVEVVDNGSAVVGVFGIASLTSVTPPATFSERADRACNSTATYKDSIEMSDVIWAPTGSTGAQSATAAVSGVNIGQLVVLRPAG